MNQTNPSETSFPRTRASKVGNEDVFSITHNHVAYSSTPIDGQTDLSSCFKREFAEAICETDRDNILLGARALIEFGKPIPMNWLKPL